MPNRLEDPARPLEKISPTSRDGVYTRVWRYMWFFLLLVDFKGG